MPSSIRKLRVFLCHASQDKSIVRELRKRLEDEGWIDPWLDERKIHPGEDWRSSIEEAVESADLVVICLSNNSVNKEGFVQKELRYAREIALEKPEGTIFLIPLRLEECDVPRGLRFIQWGDYFGPNKGRNYNDLLESFSLRRQEVLRRENDEKASRAAKERQKKETEEKARKEAEDRAAREAELLARIQAEEKARIMAAEKAHKEALEKIQKEAYEKARREAETKARLEFEVRARKAAEYQKPGKEDGTKQKSQTPTLTTITVIALACVTLIALSLGMLLRPTFLNWLQPTPQQTNTTPPMSPNPSAPTIGQTGASNRFIMIPLTSAQQSDGTLMPGKVAFGNLQLPPGYNILRNIPLSYDYEVYTANSDQPNFPTTIRIPRSVAHPISLYFLTQADWGLTQFSGKKVGKIVIDFVSGTSYEYRLVLGENIRDWGRDTVTHAVTTISSADVIANWNGTAPDGRPGGMDLLKVYLPEEFRTETIDSISIVDTTSDTTGDNNPGIHVLAITAEIVDDTPGPWEYQVEQIPFNAQSLSWSLKTGEVLILTGGSLRYKDYFCGGSAQQICVLSIGATSDMSIALENLVAENNWLAVSNLASPEQAVSSLQDEFWLSPNCGNGCSYATVAIFTGENLQNEYRIDNPNP